MIFIEKSFKDSTSYRPEPETLAKAQRASVSLIAPETPTLSRHVQELEQIEM